ncbi:MULTISPECIES: G5 domain-containing protein [unclassified Streptococcus]|uniref:G5 domain-containing protein n=1 Tax=unclassified Streptococcus TaxID=2608887 RepID=UPI0015653564|nr:MULTISPECIES: G5 domain-containing protein [unclassified Streptococcus]
MAKSNTNKRYALRKLGKIFGSVIIGLTLFLGGVLNTSFVHADGTGVTFIKDDTRRKGEEPETDVDEVGNIIVKVPAKDSVETKVIPIETEYEADPTLAKGEKKDDPTRPGKAGTETITTTYKIEGGKAVEDKKTSEVTTEMVKKVVKVGTKPTETTEPTISTEVRYEKDPEHTRGSQPTTIPSEDGLKTVTTSYKVDSKTGDIAVATVSETVTKAATPIIVKVPAKDSVETKAIPIETEYEADPTLVKGEKKDDPTRPGKVGTETITTTYKIEGGKAVEDKKTSEVTTAMVKKVVKVGTKPTETTEPTISTEVRYEKDPEHTRGSQPTTIPSEDGLKTVTTSYKVDSKTGDITVATVSEMVTKAATPIIVKVPAKDSVETKVIPIETEYLDDPTLDKGQEIEEAGEIGEITLTTIYTVDERDGTIEETTSRQITKEMVKRRIRRGTREPEKVVVPKKSSIPSYPVSVTSNQGTDAAVEPAKPVAPTGWKQENGMWYFYNTDGSMATGWVQVNGSWYYLNSNGSMATGWVQVNGLWYYLNSNGSMATGWEQVDGSWYYLNDNGSMETGWLQNNGSWYYLNSNGSMKANQWFQVGSKWYYVNASGELAVNTSIDGYRVNDNGEWVR